MLGFKNIIAFIVSLCLLNIQVFPAYTSYFSQPEDTVRVAFIGLHFSDVKQDQQESIREGIATLIEQEPKFYNLPEEEIRDRLDSSLINNLMEQLDEENFRQAAELLNVDFIFAGNIENRSNNEETTALVGNIARYDVATDNLYRLGVKSFYEEFEEELTRIDEQLIQTIVPEDKGNILKRYLPGFLIIAATAVAVAILIGGTKGQSSGEGGPTPPFKGN
jgi:hypothetical protein